MLSLTSESLIHLQPNSVQKYWAWQRQQVSLGFLPDYCSLQPPWFWFSTTKQQTWQVCWLQTGLLGLLSKELGNAQLSLAFGEAVTWSIGCSCSSAPGSAARAQMPCERRHTLLKPSRTAASLQRAPPPSASWAKCPKQPKDLSCSAATDEEAAPLSSRELLLGSFKRKKWPVRNFIS